MIREGFRSSNGNLRIASAIIPNGRGLLNDTEIKTAILEILWTMNKLGDFIWVRGLILKYPTPAFKRMLLWNTMMLMIGFEMRLQGLFTY